MSAEGALDRWTLKAVEAERKLAEAEQRRDFYAEMANRAERQLAATVDELTDTQDQLAQAEQMLTAEHAAHERVDAAIRHLGDIAQTERQLAESNGLVEQLSAALVSVTAEHGRTKDRITEADRVLFDCRNYASSNVGPECYTYGDEKPCNPCQVRHALGYGEEPWQP